MGKKMADNKRHASQQHSSTHVNRSSMSLDLRSEERNGKKTGSDGTNPNWIKNNWKGFLMVVWAVICFAIPTYISYSAYKKAEEANILNSQFGAVQAESQFADVYEKFTEADEHLLKWEESQELRRTGIVPQSLEELQSALECSEPDIPAEIAKLYRYRQTKYETLKAMVEAYTPFKARFVRIDLKLPVGSRLPWRLPYITNIELNELLCNFAGFISKCQAFMTNDTLCLDKLLDNIIGPQSKHISMPVIPPITNVCLPFKIHSKKCGYLFDLELRNKNGNVIVRIDKNRFDFVASKLPFASDADKLEILDNNGIPLFQIYIDTNHKMISLGGLFYSESGNRIIALPDKLITHAFILSGAAYNPKSERSMFSSFIPYPDEERINSELSNYKPWFIYGEKPHLDGQRFSEFERKILELLAAYQK